MKKILNKMALIGALSLQSHNVFSTDVDSTVTGKPTSVKLKVYHIKGFENELCTGTEITLLENTTPTEQDFSQSPTLASITPGGQTINCLEFKIDPVIKYVPHISGTFTVPTGYTLNLSTETQAKVDAGTYTTTGTTAGSTVTVFQEGVEQSLNITQTGTDPVIFYVSKASITTNSTDGTDQLFTANPAVSNAVTELNNSCGLSLNAADYSSLDALKNSSALQTVGMSGFRTKPTRTLANGGDYCNGFKLSDSLVLRAGVTSKFIVNFEDKMQVRYITNGTDQIQSFQGDVQSPKFGFSEISN